METIVPITELSSHITDMLRQLRENPSLVFKIIEQNKVIAELRAPEHVMTFAEKEALEEAMYAFIMAYQKGEIKPHYAWEEIRRKFADPGSLPYKTVEDAMQAIRYRGLPENLQ